MPPLCRTYASLNILDGGPPQRTAFPCGPYPGPLDQPNSFSVSPTEALPHFAHYDRLQLYPNTVRVLIRTPVASPVSRQSSPLGPYQSSLPDRPIFPRSKSSPSLYRNALMRRFKRSPRGREFFHRKKISSVKDVIAKPKNGGGLQVPVTIPMGDSCVVAAGVDWEVVDGMV